MSILTLDIGSGLRKLIETEGQPMRITTTRNRNFQHLLEQLAQETDRLASTRWRKLLELVHVLQSDGPNPEAWGQVFGDCLWLSPPNTANKVHVKIWMDWQDHGPTVDGLPTMHYRIQINRPSSKLSEDARVERPEQVRQIIWKAFGWLRE